jgi:hypothetical protein
MPIEDEMDGVQLDRLTPGRVCDVSSSLGSWLLAQRYAELEMRAQVGEERDFKTTPNDRRSSSITGVSRQVAHDRRRSGD